MSKPNPSSEIRMIEIDKINILNPRARNKKIFETIVDNISQVGLKKPITVTACKSGADGKDYDLVCGQGRLEAFVACGQKHIPAMVIDTSEQQALIMSLVENLARRQHKATDLLKAVEILEQQGYSVTKIAEKTGLTYNYIDGILKLMRQGEERLMVAVEKGQIPLTTAIQIADTPDENIQNLLQTAYETKQLRGQRLIHARRLIEKRKLRGKEIKKGGTGGHSTQRPGEIVSVSDVMKVFQKDADNMRFTAKKAHRASGHLLYVITALRKLSRDSRYNALLRAEKMDTMPQPVSDLLAEGGSFHG
jgi:ParB family chromosome partitioning protein